MKEKIILIFKGIIVGLGKIIPGVSGAMLAITLGIYDKCVYAISNFTKNIKDNMNLLFYIGIGLVLSIGIFSNLVIFLLNNYYMITMCFFIGLIIGGLPKLYSESKINVKKVSNIIVITLAFIIIIILNSFSPDHTVKTEANFVTLIGIGFLESFAMIVPGISGTALLMLVGYYDLVILRFSQIFNIMSLFETTKFFIPFGLGMLIGVIIMSKIINICFKKYPIKTYCAIVGLILSSIYILVIEVFKVTLGFKLFFISLLFIIIGSMISYILDHTMGNK